MTELIDRYVADVVVLLPRRQRHDVATELRALLAEEADGADDVPELLRRFGHPAEVAARYATPVALIDPVDTRRFLTLAVGGTALIQFGAILGELAEPERDVPAAVDQAWPVVFGFLGLLFAGFAARAWYRRHHPARWRPRPVPTDRVNRIGRLAAVVFYLMGTVVLLDPPGALRFVTGGRAAQVAYDALAYDPEFLRLRGPILLVLIVSGIAFEVVLAVLGRWRGHLPAVGLVHGLLICAVMTWVIGSGPVFTAATTDRAAKDWGALIILGSLIGLAVQARRMSVARALS
ncbi:HAAS signaling domain-containing protein [Dactylosporangium sp. NPDC051541]|uniref:HAAS signaling domain-containing protein n=1 Tax=Dactylosporangium sp. NPDC051541 TaxID=3363977 RepID=UPI0037A36CD2